MAPTKKLSTKKTPTTLSQALGQNEEASQITKAIAKINPLAIQKRVQEKDDLLTKVDLLQRKIPWVNEQYRGEERHKFVVEILREIARCSREILELGDLVSIRKRKEKNEEELVEDIMLLLIWLKKQLNINNNISPEQIKSLAVELVEEKELMSITVDELAVIFKNGKNGNYGSDFHRLDAQIIYGWIRKYIKERNQRQKKGRENNHLALKAGVRDRNAKLGIYYDEKVNSALEKVSQQLKSGKE